MDSFRRAPEEASKDRKIRRNALRSTASNYIGQLVTYGTGFLMTPFILGQLGEWNYGLWLLVGSLVAYGSLFDFGITGALTKYVAEFRARGETNQAKNIIATALWLYTLIGALVMLVATLAAPYFPAIFHIPSDQAGTAVNLVRLMGIGLGISIPSGTTYAILRGLQRFDYINLVTAGGTVLSALATVAVLLLGGDLLAMVAVNIPFSLLMQVPALLLIRRAAPDLPVGWRGASRTWLRKVFLYSSSTLAIQTAGQLRTKTDEIVIGAFLPVSSVTPYGLARRLSEAAQMLTHQFLRILLPLASQLEAEKDHARLRMIYVASTRLSLAIFIPIGLSLTILAKPILAIWVGDEFSSYRYLVVLLVAAGFLFASMEPGSMVLQGIAKHKWVAVVAIFSGVLNLGLSVILVQRIGLMGVALGTLIPNLIEWMIIFPYALKVLQVPLIPFIREGLLAALLPGIPMAAVVFTLRGLIHPATIVPLLATIASGGLVYLAGYFLVGASAAERSSLAAATRMFLSVPGLLRKEKTAEQVGPGTRLE